MLCFVVHMEIPCSRTYAICPEKIKSSNHRNSRILFNASMRTKDWWENFCSEKKKKINHWHYRKNDPAIFSIDGLSIQLCIDVEQILKKIMENAEAYIFGGIARWDFIVFKHNEHLSRRC